MRKLLVLLVLVIAAIVFVVVRSPKPSVELSSSANVIGQATPVAVHVTSRRGIRNLEAFVEQNGATYPVSVGEQVPAGDTTLNVTVGTASISKLQDGKAKVIVEVTGNGPLRRSARAEREFDVITRPPMVSSDSDTHYLYLGMADLATFNVSGTFSEAGVRVGDQKFRAWPMPGGKPGMFSLFAFAWNMPSGTIPMVYASNGAGSEVTTPITFQFPKKEQPKYTVHDLKLDDRFIQKVVGELDPNGSGDLVARFVKINSEMRRANNKTLADLRLKTADHFLWSKPFLRQPGASTEATFADTRNYIYNGQKIDQQTHLGYDLAVTANVGVQASNDGKIVYAAPLGIYGNCVVVDHGYGLQTIYGHMSRIDVKEGDMVKQGQVMGLSGMTGMAGGDHIHYAMQLDGVQIDPKALWDAHWIKDHIARRVDLPGFGQ